MPNRYFSTDPRITGPLQFLAGFGQANRETEIANAQLRGQQNQVLGAGIGQGIGNLFNVPTRELGARMQAERELRNATALQDNRQAGLIALEDRHALNDRLQASEAALARAELFGAGGRRAPSPDFTSGFGPGAMPMGPPVLPDGGMMGPPDPGQPPPQQAPQSFAPYDPIYAGPAARASAKLIGIHDEINKLIEDQAPQEDVIRARYRAIPQVLALSRELQSYRAKPPPTTDKELYESGAFIPMEGFDHVAILDPQTGTYKPSNALSRSNPEKPRVATRFDGTQVEIVPRNPIQLDETTWYVEDEDGKPHYFSKKESGDDGYGKQLDAAVKAITPTLNPLIENQDILGKATKFLEDREKATAGMALKARAKELKMMAASDSASVQSFEQWWNNAESTYGPFGSWPDDIRKEADELKQAFWSVLQSPLPLSPMEP